MKKTAILLILIQLTHLVLTRPVRADDSCPLSNPVYKDLRAAAAALEAKVLLPEGCEEIAAKLSEASRQISTSAQGLTGSGSSDNAQNQQYASTATLAVSQVGEIFDRFGRSNDHCGKALVSMSDYIVAFIDTVNGLAPLLLSFGGSSALPQAMGIMILGSAVKTFIYYFKSLSADMSGTQMRQVFIQNACGYYQLNENLRSLLQTLKGEESELDKEVEKLKKELSEIEAVAPPSPAVAAKYVEMGEALLKDQQYFKDFSAMFERFTTAPGLACAMVRSQIKSGLEGAFPAGAIQRLQDLTAESDAEGRIPTAHRNLLESAIALSRPERYDLVEQDAQVCAIRALDWVRAMAEVLSATELELSLPGRRDLSQTELGKVRKEWEDRLGKKKGELEGTLNRQKFVRALAERGANVELSELLDTRDRIRRELFGDGQDRALLGLLHYKRPAEAWLEHKSRAAMVQLKDFRKIFPYLKKAWLDSAVTHFPNERTKQFACAYGENAVLTWETAEKHMAASRLFCEAFEHTINEASHPYVTEFCLGEFDRHGERTDEGSIAELEVEVAELAPKAKWVLSWMKNAGCAIPKPYIGIVN